MIQNENPNSTEDTATQSQWNKEGDPNLQIVWKEPMSWQNLDQYVKKILTSHDNLIKINKNLWNRFDMSKIMAQVTCMLQIKKLYLNQNHHPSIIKQIQHISLPNIIHLNLSSNLISSIECLSHMQMPALKILKLTNNQITCISSLRKLFSPNISTLSLGYHNYIVYDNWLTEFKTKVLATLVIEEQETFGYQHTRKQIKYINWYFKLESKCPRVLLPSRFINNKIKNYAYALIMIHMKNAIMPNPQAQAQESTL